MLSHLFNVTQLMSGKEICEVNLDLEKMQQKGWKNELGKQKELSVTFVFCILIVWHCSSYLTSLFQLPHLKTGNAYLRAC